MISDLKSQEPNLPRQYMLTLVQPLEFDLLAPRRLL